MSSSPEATTMVPPPARNFAQLQARLDQRLQTAATPLPLNSNLPDIYISGDLNLHISGTTVLRAMPFALTPFQSTKFYMPLTFEGYCFLTIGRDDATYYHQLVLHHCQLRASYTLSSITLTSRQDMNQLTSDLKSWKLHQTHIFGIASIFQNAMQLRTASTTTCSSPQQHYPLTLLSDNFLEYCIRDYIHHSPFIMSNYNLRLHYYQGAHLLQLTSNELTLRYTL